MSSTKNTKISKKSKIITVSPRWYVYLAYGLICVQHGILSQVSSLFKTLFVWQASVCNSVHLHAENCLNTTEWTSNYCDFKLYLLACIGGGVNVSFGQECVCSSFMMDWIKIMITTTTTTTTNYFIIKEISVWDAQISRTLVICMLTLYRFHSQQQR